MHIHDVIKNSFWINNNTFFLLGLNLSFLVGVEFNWAGCQYWTLGLQQIKLTIMFRFFTNGALFNKSILPHLTWIHVEMNLIIMLIQYT